MTLTAMLVVIIDLVVELNTRFQILRPGPGGLPGEKTPNLTGGWYMQSDRECQKGV